MQTRSQLAKIAETLEGIPVWGCLPGSVAKEAGVRYGDIVMWVNGVRTKDIDDYMQARDLRPGGVSLTLFREGREISVDLAFDRSLPEPDAHSIARQMQEMGLYPALGREQPSCDPS